MTYSLNDWLRVIRPTLDIALVSQEAFANIQQLAGFLPPLRAGFECRLAENNPQVDLITAFHFDNDEPILLTEVISNLMRSGDVYPDPAWNRIIDFCSQSANPASCLTDKVRTLWLEFDIKSRLSRLPAPSVFITPAETVAVGDFAAKPSSGAITALRALLNKEPPQKLLPNLYSCFDSYRNVSGIAQLGAMLSRPLDAVRVEISGLSPTIVQSFLEHIGWEGSCEDHEPIFSKILNLADSFTIALDVGETIFPHIGVACRFKKPTPGKRGLENFLEYLTENRLCTLEKRDAILAWPGYSGPVSSSEPWPDDLIIKSMLRPAHIIGRFQRWLSHIKINFHPTQPPEAKAYLGFDHEWIDLSPSGENQLRQPAIEFNGLLADGDPRIETDQTDEAYMKRVEAYYDYMTKYYIENNRNTTIQAYLFKTGAASLSSADSNNHLARRADIEAGQRIIDAGCGVCGPAIDIAQSVKNVQIDAITNSSVQAQIARKKIIEAKLSDRVRVLIGDYHNLPFFDSIFDVAIFFESFGYSYNQHKLLKEIFRVLKPGGRVYIKDIFKIGRVINKMEVAELALFDRIYAFRTPSLTQTAAELSHVGFQLIQSSNITKYFEFNSSATFFHSEQRNFQNLTMLGKRHFFPFECLPVFLGEIKAIKPL